jgi:hypothetical protein
MRAGPNAIPAILLLTAAMLASGPAGARPHPGRHPGPASGSDMDRTLARMAARDRLRGWQEGRQESRQERWLRAPVFAPATRERVAAPPFTGWGYGGTIPGASPGF